MLKRQVLISWQDLLQGLLDRGAKIPNILNCSICFWLKNQTRLSLKVETSVK